MKDDLDPQLYLGPIYFQKKKKKKVTWISMYLNLHLIGIHIHLIQQLSIFSSNKLWKMKNRIGITFISTKAAQVCFLKTAAKPS